MLLFRGLATLLCGEHVGLLVGTPHPTPLARAFTLLLTLFIFHSFFFLQ